METARRWLQTLALVGLALAALLHVVGGSVAHAVSPPTCTVIDARKGIIPYSKEELTSQAAAFLSTVSTDRRLMTMPWPVGEGIMLGLLCAY